MIQANEDKHMDNSPIYYQCFEAIDRARRAYDYERGALAADDAQRMIYELQEQAGWYQLMTLPVGDVIEEALGNPEEYIEGRWKPHPELTALAHEACEYVAENWEGDYSEARNWALDRVEELASERGIELEPIEPIED